jgi:hypothetical protein
VNTEYLYPARGISETSQTYFNVTKTNDRNYRIVSDLANDGLSTTKFIQILAPQDGLVLGKQRLTFDVDVNSGDISNYMLRLSYRDVQTDLQPVAGSNSFEFVITDDGASPEPVLLMYPLVIYRFIRLKMTASFGRGTTNQAATITQCRLTLRISRRLLALVRI